MKMMRFFTILLLAGTMSSCSNPTEVPSGFYGMRIYLGRVVEIVEGPASLNKKPLLEQIVIFAKSQNIDIKLPENQTMTLSVKVLDPMKFYVLAKGDFDVLVIYCERMTKRLSRQEATKTLLKELNKPHTGISVKVANS